MILGTLQCTSPDQSFVHGYATCTVVGAPSIGTAVAPPGIALPKMLHFKQLGLRNAAIDRDILCINLLCTETQVILNSEEKFDKGGG